MTSYDFHCMLRDYNDGLTVQNETLFCAMMDETPADETELVAFSWVRFRSNNQDIGIAFGNFMLVRDERGNFWKEGPGKEKHLLTPQPKTMGDIRRLHELYGRTD